MGSLAVGTCLSNNKLSRRLAFGETERVFFQESRKFSKGRRVRQRNEGSPTKSLQIADYISEVK